MKKVIRLTESDLSRIIKRIINEDWKDKYSPELKKKISSFDKNRLDGLIEKSLSDNDPCTFRSFNDFLYIIVIDVAVDYLDEDVFSDLDVMSYNFGSQKRNKYGYKTSRESEPGVYNKTLQRYIKREYESYLRDRFESCNN
jgi:hypothetical protein